MAHNKILCFGELFIDMFAHKDPQASNTCFFQHAGGSPAIVAFAIANYGGNSYFVGKLSDDHFADYLEEYMLANKVKMDYVSRSKEHRCTISFIRHDEKGEREFEIYRDSSKAADLAFSADEWQAEWFDGAAALQCGSNCQVSKPSHLAHLRGVQMAQEKGTLVSYDPNIRPNIWTDHELLRSRVHSIFPYADIIKMSDDEAQFLFPSKSEAEISQELFAMKCVVMLITRGYKGASVYHKQHGPLDLDPIKVDAVDTTGAGDNFIAAFLYNLVSQNLSVSDLANLEREKLHHMIKFAHAGATLSVMQRGGMDSSPSLAEVEKLAQE